MKTHVVIMAGGVGSRLWPLSTPGRPKQFIDLLGVGRTMIQMTVDRFLPLCAIEDFWVVTSASYVDIVKEQLPGIPESHILAEPVARNTAPCIAYACWKISAECPDANIVVTPADALVLEKEKFASVISKALEYTVTDGRIVTVGITPTRPETGYGYICAEDKVYDEVVKVREFKEKPDLATAETYLEAGNFFWNAGIFVWNVRTIVSQLRAHAEEIALIMDRIAESFGTAAEKVTLEELFPTCPKISIDYAVMEKSDGISVIASDLGWSDLGSFSSVKSHVPEGECDTDGNRRVGTDIRIIGCEGCFVHAEDCNTVVVKGLQNFIVASKDGNLVVCPVEDEQKIKEYSSEAFRQQMAEK
ncbi:MAG: mannose-1-phosphate guanylyltransferase [Bacteroidales bacterium]|nr:mannose-1-phosphate guanylyltransferase [Bacteroidales bacterium]